MSWFRSFMMCERGLHILSLEPDIHERAKRRREVEEHVADPSYYYATSLSSSCLLWTFLFVCML